MAPTTRFLSKLIGLFAMIFAICLFLNPDAVTRMVSDRSLLIVFGTVAIPAGLAIVLAHNKWSGGLLPVVVTIVGWLTLLKGIFLLALPSSAPGIFSSLGVAQHIRYFLIVPFALGAYLTYSGFKARQS